jgi:hypothetical protein
MKAFIVIASTLALTGIVMWPRATSAATVGEPIELGFRDFASGVGGGSAIPPGLELTYSYFLRLTPQATIFDGLVVPPSTQTQVFDVFPEDDPADFDIIVQALTNGSPDSFGYCIEFSLPITGRSCSIGPINEIPVPSHSQIAFIRMTVPPFNFTLLPGDPLGVQITPPGFIVRIAAFGFPPLMDTSPPVVTISASPATLWPPNGKAVPVTVSGTMTDNGGSEVNAESAAYVVMDEYGQVQPKGSVTLKSNDSYSFTIALQASRNGNDQDGRHYTIVVSAKDNAGNPGFASTTVTVPYDQGQ